MTPEPVPVTVFIVMGSNIEPRVHLRRALARLRELLDVESVSGVYESAAFGAPATPRFLNAAVRAVTTLAPATLRQRLRQLEAELGRLRGEDRNAPRTIDLDVALYGRRVINEPGLRIPDPEIGERPYLALPLAEVGPEVEHPETGEPLAAAAARLRTAGTEVRRLPMELDDL